MIRTSFCIVTVVALAASAWAGPGFDNPFWLWGDPISALDNDPVGLGVPLEDRYVTGVDGNVPADRVFYARIPSSLIADWIARPDRNYGLAIMGRGPDYLTNNCWATEFMTWQWAARPRIRMDGWWSYADDSAWIKAGDGDFFMFAGDSIDGPEYTPQYCLGNGQNVMLVKWTNFVGNVPGESRTLSWGCPNWVDPLATFDVYVVPQYWDEETIRNPWWDDPDPPHPGDANLDGQVNDSDLSILLSNWAQSPRVWAQANFNTDTVVSDSDLSILLANWGYGVAVPEPTTLALLAAGGLLRRRR